jgi:hypothetical protein
MTGPETITLFRPTGTKELQLVADSGYLRWPPRLPDQPIFYPVLNEPYATEIARDWNTKFGDKIGHVTRFAVTKVFLDRYQRQIVGGRQHEEYWIPAEDLDNMNANIVGKIEVIGTFTEVDRLDYEAKAKSHA